MASCNFVKPNNLITNRNLQVGFTLIELLTVVLLISVVAGFAAITLRGDPHRIMESFAKRFTQQFELLTEQSALSGNDYGLLIETDSYRYLLWDQVSWRAPQDPSIAQSQAFPETIEVDLFLEEESILSLVAESTLLDQSSDSEEEAEEINPM